jgi:hypothetical protein
VRDPSILSADLREWTWLHTDAMGEQLWSTSTLPSDAGPRAKASIVVLDCRERGE